MKKEGTVWGGALLVTGTCIGAGILGLPISTAAGGFIPALFIFLACWAFMCATGLLFLEVCLWIPGETNIVSMARHTLGRFGQVCAWILYIYLFYSLTVAYISGSGDVISGLVDGEIPRWIAMLIFVGIFGPLVYFGARPIDKTNVILVTGMAVTYVLFVAAGIPHVQVSLLQRVDWAESWMVIPLIFVTFAYQGIVPTLTNYLGRHPGRVRKAIIFGSLIPFVAYVIWEWLILGIVPLDQLGGYSAGSPLRNVIDSNWIFLLAEFFAFFALTSSFLGVTLGLRDFLADGLRVKKTRRGRFWLCLLIFIPGILISLTDPRLFLIALRYGGGTGSALLLGLLPVIMVWVGRYYRQFTGPFKTHGGRPVLLLLGAFVLVEVATEIYLLVT